MEPNDYSSELSMRRKSGPRLSGQITSQEACLVTELFGLSSFNLGITIAEIYWLLYFIHLVAICYDLYIMSVDSRIKRIGTFLGRHPWSQAGNAEKQWERFCINYRDGLAPSANMFFSIVVTIAAGGGIYPHSTIVGGIRI